MRQFVQTRLRTTAIPFFPRARRRSYCCSIVGGIAARNAAAWDGPVVPAGGPARCDSSAERVRPPTDAGAQRLSELFVQPGVSRLGSATTPLSPRLGFALDVGRTAFRFAQPPPK